MGLPLDASYEEDVPLPAIPGLHENDPSLVGVIVSHGHPDHYGLAPRVDASVPLYIGEATQRILEEAVFFSPTGANLDAAGYLRDREPLQLGPFTVTPYLVDHSAFDAYAVLVEAGDRRLFYSGDLRAHGRKAGLVEQLLAEPPADVNALLLEGTNIRDFGSPPALSESNVEDRCAEIFRETDGMVLACYSPQNVDRLVTLHRAARRSGRRLVLDLYAAGIAKATGVSTLPQGDWSTVRVFVPQSQRVRVKKAGEFERTAAIRRRRVYPENLAGEADGLVMTFRGSMRHDLEQAKCLNGARAVWSLWHGYLDNDPGKRLRQWLDARGIPLDLVHASGHARVRDLQRFAAAMRAQQVIPIHTSRPERYPELFDRVVAREDGEWWQV